MLHAPAPWSRGRARASLAALLLHARLRASAIVEYSTVQYCTVHYSTAQCSTVQYSTARYITVVSIILYYMIVSTELGCAARNLWVALS